MPNLFSVPIFFLVFRETLEAAIVISVLLGLAEQIVHETVPPPPASVSHEHQEGAENEKNEGSATPPTEESTPDEKRLLIRKLRIQVC
jgi:high-affinity iron transporter